MSKQLAFEIYKPEYNILLVAGFPVGYTHTDETRAIMSYLKTRDKIFLWTSSFRKN
jgi:hypothetical protein